MKARQVGIAGITTVALFLALFFGTSSAFQSDTSQLPSELVQLSQSTHGANAVAVNSVSVDPIAGIPFVVSVQFKLLRLPREGKRIAILTKYPLERKMAQGWGIFLKRSKTSVRPEIYWKGALGGDFFTFERYAFLPNRTYILTVVGRGDDFISVYVQLLPEVGSRNRSQIQTETGPVFLGGMSVAEFGGVTNHGEILFGDRRTDESRLIGEIVSVAVVKLPELPKTRSSVEKLVDGGPAALTAKFPADAVVYYRGQQQ